MKTIHYYASEKQFEPHAEPLDKEQAEAATVAMASYQMVDYILQTHASGKTPFVVEIDSDVLVRAMYEWTRLVNSPLLRFVVHPSDGNLNPFGVITIHFDDCLVVLHHRRCLRYYPIASITCP